MAYQEECLFALILNKMVSTINSQLAEMQSMLKQSNTTLVPLSEEANDITLSRRGLDLSSNLWKKNYKTTLLGFNCIPVVALQRVMNQWVTIEVLLIQTSTPLASLGIRTSGLIFRSTKCSQFPTDRALLKAICATTCGRMALKDV